VTRLSQITYPPTTTELNSRHSEIRLKTSISNSNPIIWRRTINNPFSVDELWDAILKSHCSAVGLDDIHYQRFKHLPPMLLTLFSRF